MKLYRFTKQRTIQTFTVFQNFTTKYHVTTGNSDNLYVVYKNLLNIIDDNNPHKIYFSNIKTLIEVLEIYYVDDNKTLNNLSVIKEIYL